MFATGEWQGGGEFGISEPDDQHDDTAEYKCEDGTECAGGIDPVAREHDPTPADHGAKRQGQHFPAAEYAQKLGLVC